MSEKRFRIGLDDVYFNCIEDFVFDTEVDCMIDNAEVLDLLNEQQEQLDLYKEAILTMLGVLADKGIIFSGVKDE